MQLSEQKQIQQTLSFSDSPALITYFTDPLLLSYITQFLSIRDQLIISTLNKRLRFIMEQHFISLLQQNRLHYIPGKTAIHQLHFYFNRCLRIFKSCKESQLRDIQMKEKQGKKKRDKQAVENEEIDNLRQVLKCTIEVPYKFSVITNLQVGPVYTISLSNQSKITIFRTNQLIDFAQGKQKPQFRQQIDILDAKCKSQKLLMVKTCGEVLIWETDKKGEEFVQKQTIIPWSIFIPIKHVYSSYNYALFQPEHPHQSRHSLLNLIFNYQQPEKDIDEQQQYYLIALNLNTGMYYLVKVKADKLLSICVGHKQAYLIDQKHQCHVIQFQHINQGSKQLSTKIFQPLAEKKIIKVVSGYNFFLGLERNVQYIQQWTTEKVVIWLRDIGFTDFIKIAKAEKIDGRKLKNIERKYMENVLGITKLNMQQKFILCIEQVVEGKHQWDQLWVWGKNQYGQLGVNNANYIAQPQRINMDFLKQNDRIDSLFCGWYQTYLRTHRGKIYSTVITCEKKKKKIIQEKQQRDQQLFNLEETKKEMQQISNNKFKNKKRKKTEDFKGDKGDDRRSKGHKKFEEEDRWIESAAGKAFFVQAFKDYSFYIQCPDQIKIQPTKQKKLRTSKAVIDRILWDESLSKNQFKIGIIDKDMGTIQITPFQIQSFDYKETSVRYVKRNGLVVWDRDSKIDYL